MADSAESAGTAVSVDSSAGPRLIDIPVGAIRPNSSQPRATFDESALEALTESVRTLGVLQPVLVRQDGDGYELIAGERRWRAARRAGLERIPAVVRTVENQGSLEQALVENLHREDLNALEEGAAYQQLIDDFGLTHDQIAERVGKSRATVSNTLRLLQLSPSIQKMVVDGQLSAGHARALLGTADKSSQETLARRAIADGLSVRALEEAVRLRVEGATTKPGRSAGSAPAAQRPAALLELEEQLGSRFDTRVSIVMAPKKGTITIDFADVNDLERIYRLMLTD